MSAHTSARVNAQIRERTEQGVRYYAAHPGEIGDRLRELDHEWDIERALEANASSLALIGLALSLTADRRWIALPIGVTAFLLQHAVQGWCPPVPILRRLGLRTAAEIDLERNALKALRGDYDEVRRGGGNPAARTRRALEAAEA